MLSLKNSLLLWFTFALISALDAGVITGTVRAGEAKTYLEHVIVRVQNTDLSTTTDRDGSFVLRDVPPGSYYLLFIKSGFYSLVIPDVRVGSDNKPIVLKAEMFPGDEKQFLFLEIGGIQVTADRELLAAEAQTEQRISSGEIEHMQANSLSDVLDLIPGNKKSQNLGLGKKQDIALRSAGGTDQGALFGTSIVVDDVPLSNNANLQTGVGVNYGSKVQNTAGGQYDLREVVAENLKRITVQPGASSVEFGDHTDGVVLVETKTDHVPTRLKLKHNPDTQEANLMGDFGLFGTRYNYNINYGYSERDIRINGDEYQHIAASLNSKRQFLNDKLTLHQSLKYSRKLEDNNYTIDTTATKAYNRDHHVTYSQRFTYNPDKDSQWYLRNYVDYKRRNSWYNKLEVTGAGYQTDRLTEGMQAGIPIPLIYHSDVSTVGNEWSYGSKLKWENKVFTGPVLHRLLAGAEFQTDLNNGPGKSFNPLYAPGGNANTRPRSFDAIPGVTQVAVFAENKVTGNWPIPYTLNAGFRWDTYNPRGFDFGNLFAGKDAFNADQGTFFNPRFGLKLKLFQKTQLRLSYGKSSKAPALSMLYPEPYYLDSFGVTDSTVQYVNQQGVERDTTIKWAIISTSLYDRYNEKLKGYQTTKCEASIDQQIGPVALTVSGYYKQTDNIPRSVDVAHSYERYDWPNWPDTSGRHLLETVYLGSSRYDIASNLGKTNTSGFEFALTTHRLPTLNMRFLINGAFTFTKYSAKNYRNFSSSSRRFTAGDTLQSGWVVPRDMEIIPWYSPNKSWRQRMIINYNVDYVAASLGIWLTFKAQQVLLDQDVDVYKPELHAGGYYENGQNIAIDGATSSLMGLDRSYASEDLRADTRPNDNWLFSLVVSKSVFKGAEVSLFIENILDDASYYTTPNGLRSRRNPEMFWGLAFSSKLDDLFK